MRKGFYLTLDVALAASLAIIIVVTLVLTVSRLPQGEWTDLAGYKTAESTLWMMKHDGRLNTLVAKIDTGNSSGATADAVAMLNDMKLPTNSRLEIVTYDSNMNLVASANYTTGNVRNIRAFAASLPFKPASNASKWGIARLYVGR
jgi:hypothetical protein